MPITADVRKFGDTLVAQGKVTITESSKPLYALVGANDLAVEKLRDGLTVLQERGTKLQERTRAQVKALPQEYKTLPTTVKTYATDVTGKAGAVIDELSTRGHKVVDQIRRRPATKRAVAQTKTAKSNAKATKTSTTKAAQASTEAVKESASHLG